MLTVAVLCFVTSLVMTLVVAWWIALKGMSPQIAFGWVVTIAVLVGVSIGLTREVDS
jgi:hypothetical protein